MSHISVGKARQLLVVATAIVLVGLLIANAAEITSIEWLQDGFIEVLFDEFPAWNDWTMVVNDRVVPMWGEAGDVNVHPNGPVHSATGVFIGTLPWVSPLTDVEFPCTGTLQFHIPGVGPTNVVEFDLRARGCCTSIDCGTPQDAQADEAPSAYTQEVSSGIPYDPPVAGLISFGSPNALGESLVTGSAGAALPGAVVYAVNLSSTHQSYATANADGSFVLTLFAPPGSPVMIKHGPRDEPHGHRWHGLRTGIAEGVNPFPGTIIHVPYDTAPTSSGTPFATSGANELLDADSSLSANTVPSAWSLEGTMKDFTGDDLRVYAYETVTIEGTLRLHSQGITSLTDVREIHPNLGIMLLQVIDSAGNGVPARDNFMSTTLTPTGFPIQGGQDPVAWEIDPDVHVDNLRFVEDGLIEGDLRGRFMVPWDLPPGLYRPVLWVEAEGVPQGTGWISAYVVRNTFMERQAPLPLLRVSSYAAATDEEQNRLYWRLMMDDFVLGTRGVGAQEDEGDYAISSQVVTQGAAFIVPPNDEQTGLPIEYRLEPFLPMISFTDRRMPTPPLIPFELPGGSLTVSIEAPDGSIVELGTSAFSQSFHRTKTTRAGHDLNEGTVQIEDVYSLMVDEESYRVTFDQYGKHTITMTGWVEDIWGNRYDGGGTYEVWIAEPLDIDVGTLQGTPFEIGDAWNPMVTLHPRVPADITLTVTQMPESDPSRAVSKSTAGKANAYGTFAPADAAVQASAAGEYRVDLFASYSDNSGVLYAGAMAWGGVVMTPQNEAMLVAHGIRGLDSLTYIPNHWFVAERDLNITAEQIPHAYNPYYNGDILWSRDADDRAGGSSLVFGVSVQDTVGLIEAAVWERTQKQHVGLSGPGDMTDRFANDQIPLFIATSSGRPDKLFPDEIEQIAYSYAYSERPGVRVREVITEESESGGYWRLNTLYDDQPGVGILGDRPNDFKFQYVGTVFRDLENGIVEYGGQGTGWVFIPEGDPLGNRAMPPFAGEGNGGWTTEGGPILTLDGEEIHLFIHLTGLLPGTIFELGETARIAGHIMPTLNSLVEVTITSPSGIEHTVEGQANRIGYFYDPSDDLVLDEAGVWTADVLVRHEGTCSGGATVFPYPTGHVLGSRSGEFVFYVAPRALEAISITSPTAGFMDIPDHYVPATQIRGQADDAANIYYTVTMPGMLLEQGELAPSSEGSFSLILDWNALHRRFPNLDLIGRDDYSAGLADTFSITMIAVDVDDQPVAGGTITIQGERVYHGIQGGM